jgi:hypothetical protein
VHDRAWAKAARKQERHDQDSKNRDDSLAHFITSAEPRVGTR